MARLESSMASSDDRAATQVSADPVSAPESVADAPGIKVAPADASPRTHRRLLGALPAVAAVLSTLWVFRAAIFQGRLPGNIGDSRWTVALHEHWYRVWQGQEAI